ncbi:MAG: PrsW family intramembrane metalloprotease [Lachnospiraceae bacterium]|jgi:RsiW-degrading membrane proteinase PrsW (M82 family)
MLFVNALNWMIVVYVLAAILPAVFLMYYIYKMDTYEKEPAYLLWGCVLRGILAALVSIILELIGENVLGISPVDKNSIEYTALLAFLVVAVVEEGTKYFFMGRLTWRDPNFNYLFDGIVYSAFTSLGFAAFENVKYIFTYGLSVALTRAVLAVPGHLGFSVVFGYFYGRAKLAYDRGRNGLKVLNLIVGYVLAVFLHGFYDFCAMVNTSESMIMFIVFVVVMYIVIILLLRRESKHNRPV